MLKHCLLALTIGTSVTMAGTIQAQTTQPAETVTQPKQVEPKLVTDAEKLSYHLGVLIATEAKNAGDSIDLDAFRRGMQAAMGMNDNQMNNFLAGVEAVARFKETDLDFKADKTVEGIKDILAQQPSKVSPQEAQLIIMAMVQRIEAAKSKENKDKLEAWTTLKDAKTSPSGMRYVVHAEGEGNSPTVKDTVTVDYTLTLIDGTQIDSSEGPQGQPMVYPMDGSRGALIPGFIEALESMKKGSHWTIALPSELAWGPRGMGNIPGDAIVVFEIKIRDIQPTPVPSDEEIPEGRPIDSQVGTPDDTTEETPSTEDGDTEPANQPTE